MVLKLVAGTALAITLSASMASALTLASGSTTCSITDVSGSTACEGAYSGNDSNEISDTTELFGLDGWKEIDKVDGNAGTSGVLTSQASGMWSISSFDTYETFMIVLKGGPTFSAYLLGDGDTAASSGTWSTAGILKGNGQPGPGLSHITLWGTGTAAPVPLPAAAWLLLAGLGGLGAARRFKRG